MRQETERNGRIRVVVHYHVTGPVSQDVFGFVKEVHPREGKRQLVTVVVDPEYLNITKGASEITVDSIKVERVG